METLETYKPQPFTIAVPQADLDDLRQRLGRTRLPLQPADSGWQYGANGAYLARFLEYWRDGFDWRQWEARLNDYENYRVSLPRPDDGTPQTVHYLVARSSNPAARPLLLTHGWPGSVFEFIHILDRLTQPERFGGRAEDAFTVICPSLPGYGFSIPLKQPISPRQVAALWHDLMTKALGIPRFFVQAGDWGSIVSSWLGADFPQAVAAMHLNMVPLRPPLTTPLNDTEKTWAAEVKKRQSTEAGYFAIQSTKPNTLGFGLSDSPAGLAAWIVEKFHGHPRGAMNSEPPFTMDDMLATIALYWLTDTAATATWFYWAAVQHGDLALKPGQYIAPPTAFLLPPWDLVPPSPPGWLERGYNVVQHRVMPRGGHFVAMEQPDIFIEDVQAFFRSQTL